MGGRVLEPDGNLVVEGVGSRPDAGRDTDFGEGKMTVPVTDSADSGISKANGSSPATELRRPSETGWEVILDRSSNDPDQFLLMTLSFSFLTKPKQLSWVGGSSDRDHKAR